MTTYDNTVELLQDLVRINIDSCKGFETAAETIESPSIASLFRRIASDRRQHVQELRAFVEMNDEEAEDSGSIQGTIHRWWLSVRGRLSGGDDHAVLAEAERGEDAIKKRYEQAMRQTGAPLVRDVIERQYLDVRRAHDAVRELRDTVAANA